MKNETSPVSNIHQNCGDRQIRSFKVASFDELTCTVTEFEENHRHEYFEIIWLKNEKGIHQIDLVNHFYEGSVMFMLSPGQLHRIKQEKPSDGYLVKFAPSVFFDERDFIDFVLDTCLFAQPNNCQIIPIPETLKMILEDLFKNLIREFGALRWDSEHIVRAYLKILITHINRLKINENTTQMADPNFGLFRAFRVAIEKNYKKEHAVKAYADILKINPRMLHSITKKYGNQTPGEIIRSRLLLEAKRRLVFRNLSVKEIGFTLGFEDPAYFTRFFKKHTRFSPQQFKEENFGVLAD